jgi:L-lactate permease
MIKRKHNIHYDWRRIKHFFIWSNPIIGRTYFIDIEDDGQVSLTPIKGKESYKKFEDLWHSWSDTVCNERNSTQFEYPVWYLIKRYHHAIVTEMMIGISFILILLLTAVSPELHTAIHVSPKLCIILASLIALVLANLFLTRYPRQFSKISINDNALKVNFVDGSVKQFSLKSVKRCSLAVSAYSAFIVFEDNTKLTRLQHVSDWPILREHLLSKLGQSEQSEK